MRCVNVTETIETTETDVTLRHEGLYQVILYNDDANSMERVVMCLMKIFGHNTQLAVKIMLEAHEKGRAVAEIEPREAAQLHKDQLQSYGLLAAIEKCE
ncbi:MAG: ATP-dependent Clp protease adaptor ClpS [Spartobacteria bacterium]|nr:ATP-dependent Clp protease adaptor ClpS [Spartobacteria bacterium]